MSRQRPPIAVTIGEPAGIGPDIILSTWVARKKLKVPDFLVIGDVGILARRAMLLNLPVAAAAFEADDVRSPMSSALPVISTSGTMEGEPGNPSKNDAPLVIEAIKTGVDLVMSGQASALVTAPISKQTLYEAGFEHPGHTEFLAELASGHAGKNFTPIMMIASEEVRTIPVTIHIPVSQIGEMLTTEAIVTAGIIAARDFERWFGIEKPRIYVSGLNPHAGEGGALGKEDDTVIRPAIEELVSMGIEATGPWPADTMFHPGARQRYDVAICMYHDQALIPAKTLAFEKGVNVTLGLPFIRTSPDHGTAFDIAGTGKADPTSFIHALRMAREMTDRSQ
ncbi:MAG: 4-hydroxythreonine-4-phosphate dehydrogenase PdxA [Rhizobiaceae bacterium]